MIILAVFSIKTVVIFFFPTVSKNYENKETEKYRGNEFKKKNEYPLL